MTDRVQELLLGRDRSRSVLFSWVAVGVFLLGLGLHGLVWVLNTYAPGWQVDGLLVLWVLAAIAVGPAAVAAYRNDGLLVCWALGAALPVALFVVPTASPTMAPQETVWWGLASGLVFGIVAGSLGFGLGVAARWLRRTARGRPRWTGM